ncbi:MAG: hypothetical protein DRP71_09070 [Verrucomicrobia bacterium]|nr:MAG: hypothetical protein DRP71_09070 [Verrucomicrobiota bacterium]
MFNTSFNKIIMAWLLVAVAIIWVAPDAIAAGQGYGPGRVGLQILAGRDHVEAGTGGVWNSRDKLHIQLDPTGDWRIKGYKIDLGGGVDYSPPLTNTGNPKIGHFDYKEEFTFPYDNAVGDEDHIYRRTMVLDLGEDLGFQWGSPWADLRVQGVAIFLELVKVDGSGNVYAESGAWAVPELITWVVAVDEDTTLVVGEDIVADEDTGEIVEVDVTKVKKTSKGKVAKNEHQSAQKSWEVEEIEEIVAFDGGRWGWWFSYEMAHPRTGHFIDSPVAGLNVDTPTYSDKTDINARFDYFPGEEIEIAIGSVVLGSTVADHKISPLDIFPMADTEDTRVINMARLIQSLDADGDPQGGIVITDGTVTAFESAMGSMGLTSIDFSDDAQVENIIQGTIDNAALLDPPVLLVSQSAEDAKGHLDETLNNAMFRKNISKTPVEASTKAKMNISSTWFPALRANGEAATYTDASGAIHDGIPYFDDDGNLIRVATEAKPIVVTYTDADPVTGGHDTWAAVSRDDGNTWKRKNLSRAGDRSSFELANGEESFGHVKKPVFQIKGNKILVAWRGTYCRGGKPRYAIKLDDEYTFDDPYYVEDIWGVSGPQRSHDYVEDGFPEVGEVPFAALWVCRGVIATQTDVNNGLGTFVGDIIWFKPERLTSGRRDVNQIFCGAAPGAGFGLVWQEDANGVRPGKAVGPGPGWGGATTSHKTDIWYSYLPWGDHSKVDVNFVAGGDPDHELDHIERPKSLVPMSLPVRITDNDVLNQKNMGVDETTTADAVVYTQDNLTRCVKYEGGKTIVEADAPDAYSYDYTNLRALPEDHFSTMNCTNCHAPWVEGYTNEVTPQQGSPVPLVVVDATTNDYLGGLTNGDCVSCHYSHIVPRDRLVAVTPGLDEAGKCAECEANGGVWDTTVEAYYPYDGYPYINDEDSVNDGTHGYGLALDGLLSGEYHTFTNFGGNETSVAITTDGRLMDGDTGAARGNLFLQPYTNAAGKKSAWAIITYEETKGAGAGPPDNTGESETHRDDYLPEAGKNIIFHSFDFKNPDLVAAGDIINQPECEYTEGVDDYGNPIIMPVLDGSGHITPTYIHTEEGDNILDWQGLPQLAYENARRGRFMMQGPGAVKTSGTIMLMVYKQGVEGAGRPSDILMRRWVVPTTDDPAVNNPYRFENIVGDRATDLESGQDYWASGPVNMSSVTPTVTTESSGDPEYEDGYGAVKVVEWTQGIGNMEDLSDKYPYDDARAHRGAIRGNFVALGFSYTANWAAARRGNDKYDFYIRRSFDGGATWTTKPAGQGGLGTEHSITWTYPSGTEGAGTKVEEFFTFGAGEFERMRNLTQMPNHKESVIEPRIVAVPGTIKINGVWSGIPEDKQNQNVFYVAWGTSTNPRIDPITKEQDDATPADLYWSFTRDKGETYYVEEWIVNPDSQGDYAGDSVFRTPWMAKGDQEQGEVQLRMTPDGSRFYGSWLDEGEEGSDIVFRRIMPADFPANNVTTATETVAAPEDDTSSDDFTSDSGGASD